MFVILLPALWDTMITLLQEYVLNALRIVINVPPIHLQHVYHVNPHFYSKMVNVNPPVTPATATIYLTEFVYPVTIPVKNALGQIPMIALNVFPPFITTPQILLV